jgi:Reverse transcriptase (RNA-dependent DNA polymerase)
VYFNEQEIDSNIGDPIFYTKAIQSEDSEHWVNAMKEEIKSMDQNQV